MDVGGFIAQYGYSVVFAGSVLEGETFLVAGGYAAHRGYLQLPWVMAAGAVGGFLGDQIFFALGRRFGPALLDRFPRWGAQRKRVEALLQRHQAWIIVAMRFLYGLRMAAPVIIGACGIAPRKFAVFNLIGAVVWAIAVAGAGYVFGQILAAAIAGAHRYEGLVLASIAAVGAAVSVIRRARRGAVKR